VEVAQRVVVTEGVREVRVGSREAEVVRWGDRRSSALGRSRLPVDAAASLLPACGGESRQQWD
jgi:hypothetical protein